MTICSREGCGRPRAPFFGRRIAGVVVDDAWFCSPACVEPLARERLRSAAAVGRAPDPALRMRLGAWLVHNGALTPAQLATALEVQTRTGLRLGAQVQALGFASGEAVLRALAQQAGIRYLAHVDPAAIRRGPGDLDRDAVRALGLVPFRDPSRGTVDVACTAPLPYLALAAFRRITGLTAAPHLVSDSAWIDLVDAYGADQLAIGRPRFMSTHDVAEAASSIARAAADGREVRLTDARFDPFTWVRVVAPTGHHDVVLSGEEAH